MRITYGIELQETTDEYFNMMERVTDVAEDISVPGRYLVEAAPVFRFLPSWLPGMQFKRYAADAKRDIDAIVTTLLQRAREGMVSFELQSLNVHVRAQLFLCFLAAIGIGVRSRFRRRSGAG